MHIRGKVVYLEFFFSVTQELAQSDIEVTSYDQNTETAETSHYRFIRFETASIILCVFFPLLALITYKTHTKHNQTNI